MSNTADINAYLLAQQQAAAGGYKNPGMTQNMDTALFYRPNDSKLPTGNDLYSFLTQDAAVNPASVTNRTVKYDGGLTREMMGNGFGQISGQIGNGFGNQMSGIQDLFNKYGSLGGLGGVASSGNSSAVYRPNGEVNATNGASLPWGSTNPFNATF